MNNTCGSINGRDNFYTASGCALITRLHLRNISDLATVYGFFNKIIHLVMIISINSVHDSHQHFKTKLTLEVIQPCYLYMEILVNFKLLHLNIVLPLHAFVLSGESPEMPNLCKWCHTPVAVKTINHIKPIKSHKWYENNNNTI